MHVRQREGTDRDLLWREVRQQWNDFLKAFKHENEKKTPVSGVGDSAYTMFPKPRDEYETAVGLLVIKSADRVLGVSLERDKSQPPEAIQPKLVTFGGAVLAKLK
ncbi:MAG: hypothetical protein M3023_01950 [Pseudomonadota bacterium]|nr:hypothetical protein [Pseudomonadota bacterium]